MPESYNPLKRTGEAARFLNLEEEGICYLQNQLTLVREKLIDAFMYSVDKNTRKQISDLQTEVRKIADFIKDNTFLKEK